MNINPMTWTGSQNTLQQMTWTITTVDERVEEAHRLCVAATVDHPNGMIPVQTVYEMLLKLIGRQDVLEAMREDQRRLDLGEEGA